MIRTTPRTARKAHQCTRCLGLVEPGRQYLEHVASPMSEDICNVGWWRLYECEPCARRCGRGDLFGGAA